jgi:large subunit ribosomal protein L23
MRHWFRPESKKYMTVEMEQPFVWPEIPDLQPWGGKKEREKGVTNSLAAGGGEEAKEQRDKARNLREQVEMLFKKEEPLNEIIKRKKAQGMTLDKEEQKKENQRLKREAEVQAMSRLKLWEDKRTQKVATTDVRGKYVIKA